MSFGSALGSFGSGAAPAFYQGANFWQEYQKQKMAEEAAKAYGGAMGGMYPMPPAPGVPPQQFGAQPTPPGTPVQQPQFPNALPQPKPPAPFPQGYPQPKPQMGPQMPAPQPMPGGPPQGQPMPQPQGGPMGQPSPQMGGGGQPQAGGGQGPFSGMNLQQVVRSLKEQGLSDEALGYAVDRFFPMLSANAQYEYRQMTDQRQRQKMEDDNAWRDRRGDQADRGLDIRQTGQAAVQGRFDEREKRLRERETASANRRLPPEMEANRKFFSQRYNETSHTARAAYDALTRLQSYNAPRDAVDAAQEVYTRADALRWQSQQDYERFLDDVDKAAPAAAPAGKPAAAPAKAAPAAATPAGPPPPPGFKESGGPAPVSGGEWSGQGSGQPLNREQMMAVRTADEASAAQPRARLPSTRVDPNRGPLSSQRSLLDVPSEDLVAAGRRNVDVRDQGMAQTVEAPRRALRDRGARDAADSYSTVERLQEENDHANDNEMKDWITKIAKRMGIIPENWEQMSDAVLPGKSKKPKRKANQKPSEAVGPRNF